MFVLSLHATMGMRVSKHLTLTEAKETANETFKSGSYQVGAFHKAIIYDQETTNEIVKNGPGLPWIPNE